ncbi:MAG: hypothetical protein JF599_07675 [Verrucomicrobia bacterium]|nr:hypothetical protein [Verrucomicrobiota bacterium]
MPTPPTNTAPSSSSGDDRNLVPVDENYIAPSLEDRLALFWAKHSRTVLATCAVVLIAILAKGGYEVFAAQREKGIAAAYAAASTDAQLKAFIADHATHSLAGIAQLRLADQAYAAANYADAQSGYEKAAGILTGTIFGQRARIGAAIARLQAGKTAEGEAALRQIVTDLAVIKIIRAEAAYQLAAFATDAGRTEEATKWITQATAIDPAGQWAQRALLLRASQPAAAADPVASDKKEAAPAVNFKPSS